MLQTVTDDNWLNNASYSCMDWKPTEYFAIDLFWNLCNSVNKENSAVSKCPLPPHNLNVTPLKIGSFELDNSQEEQYVVI